MGFPPLIERKKKSKNIQNERVLYLLTKIVVSSPKVTHRYLLQGGGKKVIENKFMSEKFLPHVFITLMKGIQK